MRIKKTKTDSFNKLFPNTMIRICEPKSIREYQHEIGQWSRKNFKWGPSNSKRIDPLLGLVEEIGELCHAHLKGRQGIRHTAQEAVNLEKDAVGDIFIFLCDFCERSGYDAQDIIELIWAHVRNRNWEKFTKGRI